MANRTSQKSQHQKIQIFSYQYLPCVCVIFGVNIPIFAYDNNFVNKFYVKISLNPRNVRNDVSTNAEYENRKADQHYDLLLQEFYIKFQ